jgi:hypothetical protein
MMIRVILALEVALAMSAGVRADSVLRPGDRFETSGPSVVEVTGLESCQAETSAMAIESLAPSMSCTERESLSGALEVTEMTFSGFGLAAMCSVEGAPLGVVFGGLGLSTQIARFVVSRMPCENPADDAKIKALARRTVCEILTRKGWSCDPDAPEGGD